MFNKEIIIERISGSEVIAYCPWHNDKNASFYISLEGDKYGVYYCFGCGKRGRLSNKVMGRLGMSRKKKREKQPIDWGRLANDYYVQYRPAIEGRVLSDVWNIQGDSLSNFQVGYDGAAYTFPMHKVGSKNYKEVCGIQRRWLDGKKCCVEGSQLGLFLQVIIPCTYDAIFITEGVSDAASLDELGFHVIGRPSALTGEEDIINYLDQSEALAIDNIIIIPDNDDIGIKSAEDLAVKLVDCVIPKCPILFEFTGAKDIREYVAKVGKDCVKEELKQYV